jgi:4'-phosphopantetheinyl transferase EntD
MKQFSWLLQHPAVAVAELPLDADIPPLLSEEQHLAEGAVTNRQREIAAGRDCGRRALATLGLPPVSILASNDRLPVWPQGIVGSITHGGGLCAAAVARADRGIRGIGIDLEPAEPLDSESVETICRVDEAAWLSSRAEGARLLLARALFSAKESAYKALYPITQRPMEFEDLHIELDLDRSAFVATLQISAPPFAAGTRITGGIRISSSHIACAVVIGETNPWSPHSGVIAQCSPLRTYP